MQVCTLRMRQGRVSKVALRTPTSILLLTVLVAGILGPSGLCAAMCGRHLHATAVRRPCRHASHPMSGMMHHHSAGMNHRDSAALAQRSCPSNCDAVERLNLSRRASAQVRARQTGVVGPDAAAKLMSPDIVAAFCSYGGPPAPPKPSAAAFNVLRI